MTARTKQVYRIVYPNGKVYVGMDLTGTLLYFGSVDSKYVAADFSAEERKNFTIRKEILWESNDADDSDVRRKEIEFIRQFRSNDPRSTVSRCHRKSRLFYTINEDELVIVIVKLEHRSSACK